ncbi:hypothetical protein AYI70_g7557 [Smittium culicis]|uniref:Uncharacterized protein n=1 Tax=Smittium culicis TaxID=133412 RepID=A0A1R1XK77_9FUNG|nr:hypothetical protein AYI70_g7557 [Smittium culicis]
MLYPRTHARHAKCRASPRRPAAHAMQCSQGARARAQPLRSRTPPTPAPADADTLCACDGVPEPAHCGQEIRQVALHRADEHVFEMAVVAAVAAAVACARGLLEVVGGRSGVCIERGGKAGVRVGYAADVPRRCNDLVHSRLNLSLDTVLN